MKQTIWILMAVLLIASACTANQDNGIAPSGEDAGSLIDTNWQLVSFSGPDGQTPVVEGTTPTLQFQEDNQAGGSGGCNSFGARYAIQGGSLTFSELVSTLMACAEQGVDDQEQRYYEALQTAGRYEISDGELTIWYGDGNSSLNFASAAP